MTLTRRRNPSTDKWTYALTYPRGRVEELTEDQYRWLLAAFSL